MLFFHSNAQFHHWRSIEIGIYWKFDSDALLTNRLIKIDYRLRIHTENWETSKIGSVCITTHGRRQRIYRFRVRPA